MFDRNLHDFILTLIGKLEFSQRELGAAQEREINLKVRLDSTREELCAAKDSLTYQRDRNADLAARLKDAESAAMISVKHVAHRILENIGYAEVSRPPMGANGPHPKIEAIKKVREATNLGLKESKDIVEAWLAEKARLERAAPLA